jgi:hypothetical protein
MVTYATQPGDALIEVADRFVTVAVVIQNAPTWTISIISIVVALISLAGVITKALMDRRTQARLAQEAELLKPRLQAYRDLWALTEEVNPALFDRASQETRVLDEHTRVKLRDKLRHWYFEEGRGILLSREAREILVEAKDSCLNPSKLDDVSDREISQQLSKLRNQLRIDVGVYGPETEFFPEKRI